MPRNVSIYAHEIDEAIKNLRAMNKTIITRRSVEEEIENNRGKYLRAGELRGVPLRMVITEVLNQRPDTKIYAKRPVSWIFDFNYSMGGALT